MYTDTYKLSKSVLLRYPSLHVKNNYNCMGPPIKRTSKVKAHPSTALWCVTMELGASSPTLAPVHQDPHSALLLIDRSGESTG